MRNSITGNCGPGCFLSENKMKNRLSNLMAALGAFAIGVGMVSVSQALVSRETQSKMVRNFHDHRSEFSRLGAMTDVDSNLFRLTPSYVCLDRKGASSSSVVLTEDFEWSGTESELGWTRDRWNEYR